MSHMSDIFTLSTTSEVFSATRGLYDRVMDSLILVHAKALSSLPDMSYSLPESRNNNLTTEQGFFIYSAGGVGTGIVGGALLGYILNRITRPNVNLSELRTQEDYDLVNGETITPERKKIESRTFVGCVMSGVIAGWALGMYLFSKN